MENRNKKHSNFCKIAAYLGITADGLAAMMRNDSITTLSANTNAGTGTCTGTGADTSANTGIAHTVRVVSRTGSGECLLEVCRIAGSHRPPNVVFRNWVSATRASRRRHHAGTPAVSAILGVVILIGVAATAAAGFHLVATEAMPRDALFIEIEKFHVSHIDGSDSAIFDVVLHVHDAKNVKIAYDNDGTKSSIRLTGPSGERIAPAIVNGTNRGTLVSYYGINDLDDPGTGGKDLIVTITAGGMESVHAVPLGRK